MNARIGARPTVGVLALQGDVREHLAALSRLEVTPLAVRREAELDNCHGLVIPGGESTTMAKLARMFEIFEPIQHRIAEGMATFGTCAGMIMLADRLVDGTSDQETFGGLDITVRRNAFGRQVDSFEGPVLVRGLHEPVHGVFIRAPWVESVAEGVEVLATHDLAGSSVGRIVAVRQGHLMATSFHPEMGPEVGPKVGPTVGTRVGADDRIHELFVSIVREA